MIKAIVPALSGCGIFERLAVLKVEHLESMLKAVDWRTSTNVLSLDYAALTVALHTVFPGEGRISDRVANTSLDGEVTIPIMLDFQRRIIGTILMHQRGGRINNLDLQVRKNFSTVSY